MGYGYGILHELFVQPICSEDSDQDMLLHDNGWFPLFVERLPNVWKNKYLAKTNSLYRHKKLCKTPYYTVTCNKCTRCSFVKCTSTVAKWVELRRLTVAVNFSFTAILPELANYSTWKLAILFTFFDYRSQNCFFRFKSLPVLLIYDVFKRDLYRAKSLIVPWNCRMFFNSFPVFFFLASKARWCSWSFGSLFTNLSFIRLMSGGDRGFSCSNSPFLHFILPVAFLSNLPWSKVNFDRTLN